VPGASQAGAWPTKHSLLTTNYEPKSPSRRASDQSDEKLVIVLNQGADLLDFQGSRIARGYETPGEALAVIPL
jgi:hypothetical protein